VLESPKQAKELEGNVTGITLLNTESNFSNTQRRYGQAEAKGDWAIGKGCRAGGVRITAAVIPMDPFIRESIEQQAQDQRYQLISVEEDRLWFSLDGTGTVGSREYLEWCDTEVMPSDFNAASMDPRYIGSIAEGWKSGSMMLVRLTTLGRNFIPWTDEERLALEDRLRISPTESEEIDALVDELMKGIPTSSSERAINRYVKQIDQELDERHRLRQSELWNPDKQTH
jgi:hypothetical protein